MGIGTSFGHQLLRALVAPGRRRFERHLNDLEGVQRAPPRTLAGRRGALPGRAASRHPRRLVMETFASELPVSNYADHAEVITRQRELQQPLLIDSPVMRYQPTSGSTSAVKWVPYTKLFLEEFDEVISAWVSDLYRQFPKQSSGTHYWSLSWVPTEMRAQTTGDLNDDMQLLSWASACWPTDAGGAAGDRAGRDLGRTRCSPPSPGWHPTPHRVSSRCGAPPSAWACWSRWRPGVRNWRPPCLRGDWGARTARMAGQPLPDLRRAPRRHAARAGRPDGSGILSATVAPTECGQRLGHRRRRRPGRQLQALLPQAGFQGKGLWATEGVVTFPFQGRYPLAYMSHVYEFIDAHDGRVLPPWALREGQDVIPLLTTGSGLARYQMSDVLRVDAPLGQVPCFTFLGRNDGVDLVGEKTSATTAQAVLDGLQLEGALPVTLLALDEARGRTPGYALLVECAADAPRGALQRDLADQVEKAPQGHFHYKLARDLGQLQPAACVALPRMRDLYLAQCRERGMDRRQHQDRAAAALVRAAPAPLRQALDRGLARPLCCPH